MVLYRQRHLSVGYLYLWNDVFKDYEFGDAIFNEDGSKLSLEINSIPQEGKNSKVVEEKVALS